HLGAEPGRRRDLRPRGAATAARRAGGGALRPVLPALPGDAALRRPRRAGVDGGGLSLAAGALRAQAVQLRRAPELGPRLPRAIARGRAGLPGGLELGVDARPRRRARVGREPVPLPPRLLPAPLEPRSA